MITKDYPTLYFRHKLKEQCFYFIFYLHFTVTLGSSTLRYNSYSKMSVKRPLVCSWVVLFTSVDNRYIWVSLSFWCHLVYKMLFPDTGLSTRKQNMGEVIVQIPDITLRSYKYRQKQSQGSHRVHNKETKQFEVGWPIGWTLYMF